MGIMNFFKKNTDDIVIPAGSGFYNGITKSYVKKTFINAIKSNDVITAKDLIDNFNAPVNMIYEGVSILSMCMSQHKLDLAKHLISNGADTTNILTPEVCRKIVKYQDIKLLDFYKTYLNLDINGFIDLEQTLLTTAIIQNKPRVIDYLLGLDTLNLDQANLHGITPLEIALSSKNYDLAKTLIYKGATLNEHTSCIIDFALQNKDFEFIKYLNEHNLLKNDISKKLDLFLEESIIKNNLLFVKYFISCGANVNALFKSNNTPLILATKQDNIKLMQYLLNAGANINQEDVSGKSPLIFAMEKHDISLIKYIVAMGANINVHDTDGNTPLMIATIQQDADLVKYLITVGSNIFALNKDSNSALDIAVQLGNISIINSLLSEGFDDTKKFSTTLLHTAVKQNNFESLKCLINHKLPINDLDEQKNTPLLLSLKLSNVSFVKYLLENKANVNVQNVDGDSPLILAIKSQNLDLIKEFINKGANVNAQNKNQLYPLAYAFKIKNINIINYLIHNDAIINTEYVIDGQKTTPLIEAIKMGSTPLVKEFIHCGANVNFSTSDNISPLSIAKKYKKNAIKYHLITNGAHGSFFERLFGKILLLSNKFKQKCFKIKFSTVPCFIKKYIFHKNDAIDINTPKSKTLNI